MEAGTVGALSVDGPNGPNVQSVEEMIGQFTSELVSLMPAWRQRILVDPSSLEELEREVHAAFGRGADLLVAGLLAVVMRQAEFLDRAEQTRKEYSQPLAKGRERKIRLRLFGGLVVWIASLYCAPRKSLLRSPDETASGMYVELAQFGCGKGVSPGLQSRVARKAAICPSLQLASKELEREGLGLDPKSVRRITYQCGDSLLRLRKLQLLQWRSGKLPAGSELKGKRVTVQIDGGRTKIRGELRAAEAFSEKLDDDGLITQEAPGRSKRCREKTFDADWREPKLITIFAHDENGRMIKTCKATLDGTFRGPDAIAELVAMHLHRLGASEALRITFVGDGAQWIWDRIARIVELAKLDGVKIHQVLDNCHASHHISLALAALGLTDRERLPLYRQHRTLLRNGQWRRVVEELTELVEGDLESPPKFATEVAYLKKHGAAGRLAYPTFRRLGLPLGSGAIESSIRRVINLRLKSNAIFWREPNAETMLQVRAQVISDRWDERLAESRTVLRRHAMEEWTWEPRPMSEKTEGAPVKPVLPSKSTSI
jgi:hypothetical protein